MVNNQTPATISVAFCYALPNTAPTLIELTVSQHSSIEDVLEYLTPAQRSEIQFMLDKGSAWAIFGKKKNANHLLRDGERIELCRSLIADPMSARRHRAKREHKSGKM